MRLFFLVVPTLFMTTVVFSDSSQYINNRISTGKIIIDGQEMGDSSHVIKGSGVRAKIDRKAKQFSSVNVEGVFDVIYSHGSPSIKITGDDNIIKFVLSSVTNNSLKLGINKSYSNFYPIIINVSSDNIQEITFEGAGALKLDDIKTDQLTLKILGSVDVLATGEATSLNLDIRGVGDIKARGLDSEIVNIDLVSASDVEVTAHTKLQANITGVGDILYFGSPEEVSKQISGVGDIEAGE